MWVPHWPLVDVPCKITYFPIESWASERAARLSQNILPLLFLQILSARIFFLGCKILQVSSRYHSHIGESILRHEPCFGGESERDAVRPPGETYTAHRPITAETSLIKLFRYMGQAPNCPRRFFLCFLPAHLIYNVWSQGPSFHRFRWYPLSRR